MPVVTTAKKNAPSNRASRLLTASYRVRSSITPSSVRQPGPPHSRLSDIEPGPVPGTGHEPPARGATAAGPASPARCTDPPGERAVRPTGPPGTWAGPAYGPAEHRPGRLPGYRTRPRLACMAARPS